MSTKEQHSKLIQGLQDYFDNTSPEQLEKDLKELEQFNQYGPDIEECLELGRQHCMEMMKELDSPCEEAVDAALKYCLTKLI